MAQIGIPSFHDGSQCLTIFVFINVPYIYGPTYQSVLIIPEKMVYV